ncbi:type 2 lanthipeptide synthetase LanM family protein [Priestia endophytica]|uniref:type 2 lanthipeptide synthetase LanM family protein n=1 Tax=Priestia endophytica TaxID=135735 RepID=UPI000F545FD5|nr:type 2 lanthipeptide synthetase LanM family protein [Priestia endophytica]RPK12626.1 hypothetical protein FH5_02832 [Priestia endophytica]
MNNLTNILMSKEKKVNKNDINEDAFFERNIALVYKNDLHLAKESISHILSVDSLDQMKKLYKTETSKSNFKLSVFKNVAEGISKQKIDSSQIDKRVMFHAFSLKITSYFINLIKTSPQYLLHTSHILEETIFLDDIEKQFQQHILKVCYRTLVFDLNLQREKENLVGETKKEKYEHYNDVLLTDSTYVYHFFTVYPSLLRIIANEIRKVKKFIGEFLNRYSSDYKLITNKFFSSLQSNKIMTFELGLGDSHSDGRKVAKVSVEQGTIIYKPRNMKVDCLYNELVAFLDGEIKDKSYTIKTPLVLARENYGWAEYINFEECKSSIDIHDFYQNLGNQIALLYALNAVDFHSENLIAHGSQPVLIDLESLFHVPYEREVKEDAYFKAQQKLNTSVRSLGLLPFFFGGKNVDISGIGRRGKVKSVMKVPQIVNQYSDDMKIERNFIEMNPSMNHPVLKGKQIYAKDYVEDLKVGFKQMFLKIKEHANKLIEIIEKFEADTYIRFIARPTVKYSSLLELSFHPRFLHNSIDREAFLAKLWEESKDSDEYVPLIKHEHSDLMNNDIPYFKVGLNSTNLLSSRGKRIPSYFKETPSNLVKRKIGHLSDEDLRFQLNIIELSMLASEDDRQEVIKQFVSKDPSQYEGEKEHKAYLIHKAEELAMRITKEAYQGVEYGKRTYSWMNTTPVGVDEIQWNVSVMGDMLYEGLSGMALMYMALFQATHNEKYLDMAEDIMKDIMSRFEDIGSSLPNGTEISIGAFSGITSIVYTLLNFYAFTKKEQYKTCAKMITKVIPELVEKDKDLDLISGTAGALVVLIRYYEMTGDNETLLLARKCSTHLLSQAIKTEQGLTWKGVAGMPLTGFSHGNAGIIFALHLFYQYCPEKEVEEGIKEGLKFENSYCVNGNWIDLRKPQEEAASSAWCHGAPGILLSRIELSNSSIPQVAEQAQADMDKALGSIFVDGFGREQSLCHGDVGNSMILLDYGRKMKDEKMIHISRNLLAESIMSKENGAYQCGIGKTAETPNLMVGFAGMVYGMIYAYHDKLPNLLTLEVNLPS